MKKVLCMFLVVIGFSSAVWAQYDSEVMSSQPDTAVEGTIENKTNSCYGYASCGNFRVACTSYGQGCSWKVVSRWGYDYNGNRYRVAGVRCVGYDGWGNWASFHAWCND